jgi:hypothetical protein
MDWSNKKQVLASVRQDGVASCHASAELLADRDFILEAVRRYGYALAYAATELRTDLEVVLMAIWQRDWALECAAPHLWLDPDFWDKAVEQELFGRIPYRGEPDPIVLVAVSRDPAVYDQLDET